MVYYRFAQYLPWSGYPIIGKWCQKFRYELCKRIFKSIGTNVNIEPRAHFGSGNEIEIGDNSGIGINADIPYNTKIGKNVMMGPNCYILSRNHAFSRLDIPMRLQGYTESSEPIIGDDVWIGRDVLVLPGRVIASHSIIGARCVLTRNFPEWSIVGGNPGKLIRCRKNSTQ